MKTLTTFSAVHASGLLIPNRSTVTALALLFDKVYLPAHIEPVKAFSQKYRIQTEDTKFSKLAIKATDGSDTDPFSKLTAEQRRTATLYLEWCMRFSFNYSGLFGAVFQTNAFEDGKPLKAELIKLGAPGELNTYKVGLSDMRLTEGDEELYPKLLDQGYLPIVTNDIRLSHNRKLDGATSKQLAALLAMKSVEMLFPRTRAAHPDLILEARDRLRGHLPQFWSSMFKLTNDLKKLHKEAGKGANIQIEAENLVDATVRPALLDLTHKLEADRKQWFHHILSPVQKGLRLMVGNPPINQQQLITNALILASDATSGAADHLKTIEALKQNSGLTYLLELDKIQGDEAE